MVARRLLIAGSLGALFLAAPLLAATIRVPAQQPTIRQGIVAAATGDTVLVSPGTYAGPNNRNLDFQGKNIVLLSVGGARVTIIRADGTRGFNLHSGESAAAIIDGFSITNGTVLGDPGDTGAGIRCDGASPTIRNCIISDNFSYWDGAGVSLENSTATLQNCVISNNTAFRNAGGIYCGSTVLLNCTITNNKAGAGDFGMGGGVLAGGLVYLIDCTISGNTVTSSGDDLLSEAIGGGIVAGGTVSLTRCTVNNNVAQAINKDSVGNHARGGGASLSGDVQVTDCVFRNNRVEALSGPESVAGNDAFGGGVYYEGGGMTATRCQFIANSARAEGNPEGNSALGGAVDCGKGTFIDCLFADNQATAGVTLRVVDTADGGALAVGPETHLEGCTIVKSSAATGAAVYLKTAGTVTMENSILGFSAAGEVVTCATGATPLLSCTDVFGNAGGNWVGCIAGQANQNSNFSADPLFCNAAIGNYTLDPDSPCAPDNSPGSCELVGAFAIGCGVIGVADAEAPAAIPVIRVVPNPVAPDGRISWTNTIAGPQSIHLYDPLGRLVLRHELGLRPAGAQEVRWGDVVGEKVLRAGIYFVTFELGNARTHATRVLVVR